MQKVGQSDIGQVKGLTPDRSTHNLSYSYATTMKAGDLIPFCVQECLPGDQFKFSTYTKTRLQPTLAPFMGDINVEIEYFFVPNRLIWDDWEEYISRGITGETTLTIPTIQQTSLAGMGVGTLWDYLGLPLAVPTNEVNSLPIRAYNLIWNWYYRNQEFQAELPYKDVEADKLCEKVLKTNWGNDFFTTAKPDIQRGTPPALPVQGKTSFLGDFRDQTQQGRQANLAYDNTTNSILAVGSDWGLVDGLDKWLANNELSATTFTMNDMYFAQAVNSFQVLSQFTGYLYPDYLQANYGTKPENSTLQIPEHIGGDKSPLRISEVLQTSQTTADSPQGNLAGHGLGTSARSTNSYRCQDFGYIIGLVVVQPVALYDQRIDKKWTKKSSLDFFNPLFGNLPAQPILNQEIYASDDPNENLRIWAYQPAWQELRTNVSYVTNELRPSSNLNYWSIARSFDKLPALNSNFLETDLTDRIFAVDKDKASPFIMEMGIQISATRPIPQYSIPAF